MSWALVKRGLDLFDDDELTQSSGSRKKVVDGNKSNLKRVSTHRQGIRKAAKKLKRAQQKRREIRNQLLQKQVVSALKKYKENASGDRTEENLKLLKKLDGKIKVAYAKKITEQHKKTLSERITKSEWRDRLKKKKEEESEAKTSVFTDEDFEKMNDIWLRLNSQ